jgi:curved DNA-binding protein CbpA
MSAPLAGRFQDHYEVLAVDPKADAETIHRAYNRLATKFHPSNKDFADKEKYDAVTLAFEVLSDPMSRRAFDSVRGGGRQEEESSNSFSGHRFFDAIGRETNRRAALLCVLYDRRQQSPFRPSLSMRQLDTLLSVTQEELNLSIWYLKKRGYVASDDKSSLLITVDGMDFLEKTLPTMDQVRPFLKVV